MSIRTGGGRTNDVRNDIVVRGTPFLHKLFSPFQRVSISQFLVTQESTQSASRSQPLSRNRRCGQKEKRPKQDAEQQEYVAGMASNDRHGGGGSSVQEVPKRSTSRNERVWSKEPAISYMSHCQPAEQASAYPLVSRVCISSVWIS